MTRWERECFLQEVAALIAATDRGDLMKMRRSVAALAVRCDRLQDAVDRAAVAAIGEISRARAGVRTEGGR